MPCKHYKNALIEAAASGAQPQGDLRAHLAACSACRATFEQEQSLFASIDAGLHVAANAEMPASLLPTIRARLAQGTERRTGRTPWLPLRVLIPAIAVTCLAIVIVLWQGTAKQEIEKRMHDKTVANFAAPRSPGLESASPISVASGPKKPNPSGRDRPVRVSHSERPVRDSFPEVLVQPEEEKAFEKYLAFLRIRRNLTVGVTRMEEGSLDIAPVEIGELQVKPLEESEGSGN